LCKRQNPRVYLVKIVFISFIVYWLCGNDLLFFLQTRSFSFIVSSTLSKLLLHVLLFWKKSAWRVFQSPTVSSYGIPCLVQYKMVQLRTNSHSTSPSYYCHKPTYYLNVFSVYGYVQFVVVTIPSFFLFHYQQIFNISIKSGGPRWAGIVYLPNNLSTSPDFNEVRLSQSLIFFVMFCRPLCVFLPLSFGHYIVCPFNFGFPLPIWYPETFLTFHWPLLYYIPPYTV
jgi:hypothetical protein